MDGRAGVRSASERHAAVVGALDAELGGDPVARHGRRHDEAVGDDAIDLRRLDPGIGKRRLDGLDHEGAEPLFGAAHGARGADTGDGDGRGRHKGG